MFDINSPRSRHKVNIKKVWSCLYDNTYATTEAQFMRKLSNPEAEFEKKTLTIKNGVWFEYVEFDSDFHFIYFSDWK